MGLASAMIHELKCNPSDTLNFHDCQLGAWEEISERFETRSIERGTTQLHHHIVKVC